MRPKIFYPNGLFEEIPDDGIKCLSFNKMIMKWSDDYSCWLDPMDGQWHYEKIALSIMAVSGYDPVALKYKVDQLAIQAFSPTPKIVYPNGVELHLPVDGLRFTAPNSFGTYKTYTWDDFISGWVDEHGKTVHFQIVDTGQTKQVFVNMGPDPIVLAWRNRPRVSLTPNGQTVGTAMKQALDHTKVDIEKKPCQHSWKKYVGLIDSFDYCEHCDEKRR